MPTRVEFEESGGSVSTDFVKRGKAWLIDQLLAHDSKEADYLPHGDQAGAVRIRVVPRRTRLNSKTSDRMVVEAHELDFIVAREDYPADPDVGDVIAYAGFRWEVATCYDWHSVGTAAWKWCNGYFTARRIHTKRLEEESDGTGC